MYDKYDHLIDDDYFKLDKEYDEIKINQLENHLNLHLDKKKILVSLSGGVDSMVLLDIFRRYSDAKIHALHINYNNRVESKQEAEFLEKYCSDKNIELFVHHIDDVKRNDKKMTRNQYEEYTKKLKYDFYKILIEKHTLDGVYLAHHNDDVIENIFNNIMKNNHYEDLSVIKSENTINNIRVFRPFIGLHKDSILDYAIKFRVPYFKDTTPLWSCRGKMRRNIFPNLEDCYGNSYMKSLLTFSEKINQTELFLDNMIRDYFEFEEINDNLICLKKQPVHFKEKNIPAYFWEKLFNLICIHFKIKKVSKKVLKTFTII